MPPVPSVLLCLAHGSEAMEVVTFLSLLPRAGIRITVASVEGDGCLQLYSSDNILLHAEQALCNLVDEPYDLLLLAGGERSAATFKQSPLLIEAIKQCHATHRYIAAMSNIPYALLDKTGLFTGANMTCLPLMAAQLTEAQWQDRRVVWDPRYHLLTGQGPMCATDMSLKIIELLKDKYAAHEVTHGLALPIGIYNFQE